VRLGQHNARGFDFENFAEKGTHPRVFLHKSVDLLENTGVTVSHNDKEFVIA